MVITGCFSLPLFTNKKDKKSSASVHVTSKLSMVKTKFSGILLKSIADIKRRSTYQLTNHGVSQYCTHK